MHKSTMGGRRFKPKEVVAWEKEADLLISNYRDLMTSFKNNYDETKHVLRVDYVFHIESNKLFTKKGVVSKRSGDTDNLIKPINDKIFGQLKIDDAMVYKVSALKVPGPEPKIECTIKMIGMNDIPEYRYHRK